MILTIVAFVLILSFLVFVHEFGHYFAAIKIWDESRRICHWNGPINYIKRLAKKLE